jgi:hypothetical protein
MPKLRKKYATVTIKYTIKYEKLRRKGTRPLKMDLDCNIKGAVGPNGSTFFVPNENKLDNCFQVSRCFVYCNQRMVEGGDYESEYL